MPHQDEDIKNVMDTCGVTEFGYRTFNSAVARIANRHTSFEKAPQREDNRETSMSGTKGADLSVTSLSKVFETLI